MKSGVSFAFICVILVGCDQRTATGQNQAVANAPAPVTVLSPNNCDKMIGTWSDPALFGDPNYHNVINKDGNIYTVRGKGAGAGPCVDGIIKTGGATGDVTYAQSTDSIFFEGFELKRVPQ